MSPTMSARSAAVLEASLDDVEPTVTRRVVAPADIRLDRLPAGPTATMPGSSPGDWIPAAKHPLIYRPPG
jgi:hypothetical protein